MARIKKESGKGPARNGSAARRRGTASPARRPASDASGFQKELRAARDQAIRETRAGYEQLGQELKATASRLAESVRHAQEQLTDIVRQAREARRDVEELRKLARDSHREGLGEPTEARGRRAAVPTRTKTDRKAAARKADQSNRFGVTVGGGIIVAEVRSDSPAEEAGLKRGDVIEEINGTPILSAAHLRDTVQQVETDTPVTLRLARAGEIEEVRATIANGRKGELAAGQDRLGVTAGPGVVIAEVLPDTAASRAGLERGDVIDDLNGTPIVSAEQFRDQIQRLPGGQPVVVHVMRAGKAKEIRATL